ncbi:hypothetical protein TCDM_13338 [Trypanosoma cruzi Dm28c]|uniref:Uncharacterized protein n=1 Tax=Trypanosoma cruzi Dm28c TaxID=1416333 RepID=V5CIM4_TRYCR|nr:hypothetical protein TCDM_13338 [Trypanosoma cruzi Dm28c]
MPKARGHHTTHTERAPTITATRASGTSSIHDAATKLPAIPPSMGHGAQLNAVTRGASHPQERRRGLRTPSPPFSSWPRKKTTAATRNFQHALQKKHSNPLQCAPCVCACRNTEQKEEKRKQSMWRDAQQCTAEVRGGNNKKKTAQTHDCTADKAAAIHKKIIQKHKKKLSPPSYTNPIAQNNCK